MGAKIKKCVMSNLLQTFSDTLREKISNSGALSSPEGAGMYNSITSNLSERKLDCKDPKNKKACAKRKKENKEATGSGGSGQYSAPINFESKKTEAKEAVGASSSGSYETPAMWAKSTSKKDWRGAKKPLYPGGKFVTVKKKCKKYPYCNQGDINALKLTERKQLVNILNRISEENQINFFQLYKLVEKNLNKIYL